MKTIARTLIILLAAGLISLGWYTYAATATTQTSLPDRSAEFAAADDATEATAQTPPPLPEGGEHPEQGLSMSRVLSGITVIIGQTALVIILVWGVRKLGQRLTGYFNRAKSSRRLNAPPHPN